MQLSLRLKAIADMVSKGNRLVDVGCDHGYLPVYLVLNKVIPFAIAMDVRKGPLSKAQEHIARYHLEEYIETRLSNGLEALQLGEGDTLVIAGMGGPLMESILEARKNIRDSFKEMILQPQSDIPHFRKYILEQGWDIIEEKLIEEDGKFYPMMKVIKTEEHNHDLTQEEMFFGRNLLLSDNNVFIRFLEREKRIKEEIKKKLEKTNTISTNQRFEEIQEELQLINTVLKKYESI